MHRSCQNVSILTDSTKLALARATFWATSFVIDTQTVTWHEEVINAIDFLQHSVLQVPFFLMNLWKFLSPALDDM